MPGPSFNPVHEPAECWVVLYWSAVRAVWVLQGRQYTEEAEARLTARIYSDELGPTRVRLLHTADSAL